MGCGSSTADKMSSPRQTTTKQQPAHGITPSNRRERSPNTNTYKTPMTAQHSSPKPKNREPETLSEKLPAITFVDVAVESHNQYRSKHGAPPLRVAKDLMEYSQNWANDIASRDTMEHSKATMPSGGRVGENIYYYWSSEGANIRPTNAKDAVDAWYNEIEDYNFTKPGFKSGIGHFTQVVWKGSHELGIAAATSKSGSVYVVANYRPAGNMMGSFPGNVLPPGTVVTADPPSARQSPTRNTHGQNRHSDGTDNTAGGRGMVEIAVNTHNTYRSKHDAPPMRAASDLTAYSQKWADEIAKRDTMVHSKCTLPSGGRIGENIYCYWSSAGAEILDSQGEDATKAWYDEIKDYNFNNPSFSMKTGHFTQVVWKESVELGIAAAVSKKGTVYVVANYRPAGNMMGDFPINVIQARR